MGNKFARSLSFEPDAVLREPRTPGVPRLPWSKLEKDPEDAEMAKQDAQKDRVLSQDAPRDKVVFQDAQKDEVYPNPEVHSRIGSRALKCVTLLGILVILMLVFFFLVVLVDENPKLPRISLSNATIQTFETDDSASVLNINIAFNMSATSDYKLTFHFPSGRLFLAYKLRDTEAYNIGTVVTPDFSIGKGIKPFVAQCNQTLVGFPQDVLLNFRNDLAAGKESRAFIHGGLYTTYSASRLVSNHRKKLQVCYNLTIIYPTDVACSTPPCPRSTPVLEKVIDLVHCNPESDDNSNVSRF